jgi:hypothetical protein
MPDISFEELAAPATPPTTAVPADTTPAAAAATPATDPVPAFTEADADALRSLADLGITPQNAKDFIEAKTALANLSNILQNNPRLFLQEIEKTNPTLASTLKREYSDAWYEEYVRTHPEEASAAAPGGTSRTAPSPDPEIASIKQQLNTLIEQRNQELSTRQQEAMTTKFNAAVDESLGKLPEAITESQKDYIRLKAQEMLWKDSAARDRVAKGVNVDVSKYIAKATTLVTAETKAAANTEKDKRQQVESRGSKTIVPAAEAVGGEATEDGPSGDRIWDAPLTQNEAAKLKDAFR